jgi:hypothetical protein
MEGRDVLSDIHHGLRGVLQNTEPVLDISHDLAVILLVFLKELGILFHLVVHLTRKSLDLVLQRCVEVVEFLLKLKEGLEGLIISNCPLGQTLKNPENCGEATKRYRNRDQDQKGHAHEGIILKGVRFS